MFWILLRLLVTTAAIFPGTQFANAQEQDDSNFEERIISTPDLSQIQRGLPRSGSQYCAPVSASNSLAWLSTRGFPKLMAQNQLRLVTKLGSPRFMDTNDRNGTGINGVMTGLNNYVRYCGYKVKDLAYQGWRPIAINWNRVSGHANVTQIINGLKDDGIVLLNVGWYKSRGQDYQRVGGHWVTLVGLVGDGSSLALVVHDSSSRSPEGHHERVIAKEIRTGRLVGSKNGLPVTGVGAWQLGGELKINTSNGADTAILDGAVLLRLEKNDQ